jgi:FtsP/CotA-like multicopper oxidase with cupredoxin domain
MVHRTWFRSAFPVRKHAVRKHAVRVASRPQSQFDLERLEQRTVMAAENVIFPTDYASQQTDLRPLDVIKSQNGVLEANVRMVTAGFDANPILYGGREVYSSVSDEYRDYNSYAMAYQFDAYGKSYPAGFPGTMLQINSGDTLKLRLTNDLAVGHDPSDPVFTTNFHYHGSHAPDLSTADNVYVHFKPGETVDINIPISTYENSVGANWYHPHVHEVSKKQVEAGLAGMIMVGNPLEPWPQYKDELKQVNLVLSQSYISVDGKFEQMIGTSSENNYSATGTTYTDGWQKRVNGQMNPIIRFRPGETQVLNMGQFGSRGATNFVIADDNLQNPWNATILARDGASAFVHPYNVTLSANELRMQDVSALTVLSPGNRMSMAVTAPTTPGTYYFMDGWGGEESRNNDSGTGYYYVLATLVVEGNPVTTAAPVFAPQEADPLWKETPDVTRTFSLEQLGTIDGVDPDTGAPIINIDNFYINGKKFGEGVMPQLEIGTVEEWTILNAGPLNHPFHIHQGVFIVTKINGFPIEPDKKFPDANAANYVSPLDTIMVPAFGSVTIRFRALDFPGKYVFHCHILEHEDEGMMSPVFQFGNTEGLRLALGTTSQSTTVVNGKGNTVGTIKAFPNYRGPVVTASGIGTSTAPAQAPPFGGTAEQINAYFRSKYTKETLAFGTGSKASWVSVYENGSLKPSATFRAFAGKAGVGGVSLAVGALGQYGTVNIAVGSRAAGAATVRLFDTKGSLVREFKDVLPGNFPNGVNVAVGDVDADNYDDIIVSAGSGREPIITALSGRDIVDGVANPAKIFTFVAPGGRRDGVKVAVGYVAPSTVPSYKPNLITTPETGRNVGAVSVWNVADFSGGSSGMPAMGMKAMGMAMPSTTMPSTTMPSMTMPSTTMPSTTMPSWAMRSTATRSTAMRSTAMPRSTTSTNAPPMPMAMPSMAMPPSPTMPSPTMPPSTTSTDAPPMPVATFRPFGTRGAVNLATTYQRQLGGQAQAVVATWQTPREVAFTAIGLNNQPQTVKRKF